MTIGYIVLGLVMGIVFGIALEKGRVFEPGVIVGQFQLRNFLMVRMFLSAMATTMVLVAIMVGLEWATLHIKAAIFPATIIGGLLLGAGMALSGACPGTVLAQIGAGYRDAWAILVGALFGAIAYGYMEPVLAPLSSGPGKITVAGALGMSWPLLAVICAAVLVAVLVGLEKWRSWRDELGRDYEGLLAAPEQQEPRA